MGHLVSLLEKLKYKERLRSSFLEDRLLGIEGVDCNLASSPSKRILPGGIMSVSFYESNESDPPIVSIRITDNYNGKK